LIVHKTCPCPPIFRLPYHNPSPPLQVPISLALPLPRPKMTPRRSRRLANPSPPSHPKPPHNTPPVKRKQEVIDLTASPPRSSSIPAKRPRTTKPSKAIKTHDVGVQTTSSTVDACVGTETEPEMRGGEVTQANHVEPISKAFMEEMTCPSCRKIPRESQP
jgi:hypothetical protein